MIIMYELFCFSVAGTMSPVKAPQDTLETAGKHLSSQLFVLVTFEPEIINLSYFQSHIQ